MADRQRLLCWIACLTLLALAVCLLVRLCLLQLSIGQLALQTQALLQHHCTIGTAPGARCPDLQMEPNRQEQRLHNPDL
jgi:hypothetical protein